MWKRLVRYTQEIATDFGCIFLLYLVASVDVPGKRDSAYRAPKPWARLERATFTTLDAFPPNHDYSYIMLQVREKAYGAAYLISTLMPAKSLSVIDIVNSEVDRSKKKKSRVISSCLCVFGAN